ncbi:MAG: class I SAM-dependent methyltransferase [Flexistipes sinusarabici]|uniref:Class I SAM-dependent methyltransferase n=1 Tax=Flexistipes sinusarabici TaxID=2352 RepID=A0A5D0MPR5_FLESI|nr:class I SAM-dependent methyltransferase [Flexistipes sinusarabici]TYB33540.1 MAG: class I SAM-dependent methyltransferase [Flexistipes sinusarabici]
MSFDESAFNYKISSDHKTGTDLDILKRLFGNKKFDKTLDVAAAAGHCAKIFNAKQYVVSDLSFNMLKEALSDWPVPSAVKNCAETLPFKTQTFDLISCRIALHHFRDAEGFFKESSRALKNNGFLVLIDSLVDIEDAYLNTIEFIRDPSHFRSYTFKEIVNMTADYFRIDFMQLLYKKHNFDEWSKRLNPSRERLEKISQAFLALPENIKHELSLEIADENILSYTDKKAVIILRKL